MGRLLTAQQVAERIPVETLARRDLPAGMKLGDRRVWDEDEIAAWIERQQESS